MTASPAKTANGTPPPIDGGATNDSFLTLMRRLARGLRTAAWGHEGQFEPPRVSGRSAFREETFAGRCGNEKNAPTTWSAVCYLAAASKLPDSSGAATG
jgi:hypothetical protein